MHMIRPEAHLSGQSGRKKTHKLITTRLIQVVVGFLFAMNEVET